MARGFLKIFYVHDRRIAECDRRSLGLVRRRRPGALGCMNQEDPSLLREALRHSCADNTRDLLQHDEAMKEYLWGTQFEVRRALTTTTSGDSSSAITVATDGRLPHSLRVRQDHQISEAVMSRSNLGGPSRPKL